MTGLTKMISQIELDSASICAELKKEAALEAEALTAEAKKRGEVLAASIDEKTDARCKDILYRGASAAELEKRRTVLKEKQQIIAEMLVKAEQALKELPADQYFDLLLKIVAKNSIDKDGEIIFNQTDLNRLPPHYAEDLNQAAKGCLFISPYVRPIDSGFILVYGGVEENCTFSAMFASEKERLSDQVSELLFAE